MKPFGAPSPQALVKRARGSLHDRFGWHLVDHGHSHWDQGEFVSRCSVCQRVMIKQPGKPWQVRRAD